MKTARATTLALTAQTADKSAILRRVVTTHAHPSPPGESDLPLDRLARHPLFVVGIDTSSARLACSLPKQKTYVLDADGSPDERRIQLYRAAREFFATLPDGAHVFCEEPLALKNGETTRLLGLAAGAIWAAHVDFNFFWHWMNVSTWKKEIGISQNTKKEFVRPAIEAFPSFKHEDREEFLRFPDLYDAWAIRMTGARLLHTR